MKILNNLLFTIIVLVLSVTANATPYKVTSPIMSLKEAKILPEVTKQGLEEFKSDVEEGKFSFEKSLAPNMQIANNIRNAGKRSWNHKLKAIPKLHDGKYYGKVHQLWYRNISNNSRYEPTIITNKGRTVWSIHLSSRDDVNFKRYPNSYRRHYNKFIAVFEVDATKHNIRIMSVGLHDPVYNFVEKIYPVDDNIKWYINSPEGKKIIARPGSYSSKDAFKFRHAILRRTIVNLGFLRGKRVGR